MMWFDIVFNIVFWVTIIFIAFNENKTPYWAYFLLTLFIIYSGIRTVLAKQGVERFIWIYTINMIVAFYILYVTIRKN